MIDNLFTLDDENKTGYDNNHIKIHVEFLRSVVADELNLRIKPGVSVPDDGNAIEKDRWPPPRL